MKSQKYVLASGIAAFALLVNAQTQSRRANITGGGDRDRGKCTIEVVVDSVAEVEVRGDTAVLRTLGGQPAQWRRFQCNTVMPPNPGNFRFSGIDGRGRQSLLRNPGAGSPAVVRIEDPQGGSEGYTFDLEWREGFAPGPPPPVVVERERDRPRPRFTVDEAIRVCRDVIADRARDRFRDASIEFRRVAIDDQPGRNDWVLGSLEVVRRNGPRDVYRFSCSVNFDTGKVRSAEIDRDRIR
jgi:hypothetical protein